jgi:broad specificity phosphatase PhoE
MKSMVFLVRHGESLANAGGITCDHAAIPLTELGWQQARDFAAGFTGSPALFVVSPFQRAQQTAAPMLERFPRVPVEEWPVQEYTYLEPTRYNDLSIHQRKPDVLAFWGRADPAYRDGEGAETFSEFVYRVSNTLQRLRAMQPNCLTVVFTQGLWMQVARLLVLLPGAGEANIMRTMRRFNDEFPVHNLEAIGLDCADGRLHLVGQEHLRPFVLEGEPAV